MSVHDLTAKGMNLIEMAGLMSLIDTDFNGVVLMQIGMFHLAQTPKELAVIADLPRLMLDTPHYDREIANVAVAPGRTGNYFLDHWKQYSYHFNTKFFLQLLNGPIPEVREPNQPLTDAAWEKETAEVSAYVGNYKAQRDRNRAIVDRMIDRIRRHGQTEIILLEPPFNPRGDRLISAELRQDHDQYMAPWAQTRGLHYWALNRDADLLERHFFDFVHVHSVVAETRYTHLLAERIATFLSTNQATEESP